MKKYMLYFSLGLLLLALCGCTNNKTKRTNELQGTTFHEEVHSSGFDESILETDNMTTEEITIDLEKIKKIAKDYYAKTVFEVISMDLKKQIDNKVVLSVCVSKDGVVQDPNRSITLKFKKGKWIVTGEGY